MNLSLAIVFSFFIGTFPSAWLITGIFGKRDIRLIGSGNPGASNVYRECGAIAGLITLALDVVKGAIPVLLVFFIDFGNIDSVELAWLQILFGGLSWLGHIFNPFFGFSGGKGVATLIGIFGVLFPLGLIYAAFSGLIVMIIYRWFSLGSLIGVSHFPIAWYFFLENPFHARHYPLLIFILIAFVMTHLRHAENVRRIIQGTESSIHRKS